MAMSELQKPIITSLKAYLATGNSEVFVQSFKPLVGGNIYFPYLPYYLHISAARKTIEMVLLHFVKRSVGQGNLAINSLAARM